MPERLAKRLLSSTKALQLALRNEQQVMLLPLPLPSSLPSPGLSRLPHGHQSAPPGCLHQEPGHRRSPAQSQPEAASGREGGKEGQGLGVSRTGRQGVGGGGACIACTHTRVTAASQCSLHCVTCAICAGSPEASRSVVSTHHWQPPSSPWALAHMRAVVLYERQDG